MASQVNARPMTAQVLDASGVNATNQGAVAAPPPMSQQLSQAQVQANGYGASYYNWAVYLIWFLVAAVLTWIILYATKPAFVRLVVDGEVVDQLDTAKVLITSIIVGIIVLILVWLFRSRYN